MESRKGIEDFFREIVKSILEKKNPLRTTNVLDLKLFQNMRTPRRAQLLKIARKSESGWKAMV